MLDEDGQPHELLVGELDLQSLVDDVDCRAAAFEGLRRFDRALADVRSRTGAKLSVFAAYAPSEDQWYGVNFSKAYAVVNIGFLRPIKAYKWTIVHELAHQAGHGHDQAFNSEFQNLAMLIDPSTDDE